METIACSKKRKFGDVDAGRDVYQGIESLIVKSEWSQMAQDNRKLVRQY